MQDSTNKTQRPRGRPRGYDPDTVALRIVETFWAHGYAATSLDQLATATGLNRPSLYAAFGDKKAMYRQALTAFAGQVRGAIERALAAPDIGTALRQFYRSAIAVYRSGDAGPRGCLFVCTAATEAVDDAEIRADIAQMLQTVDTALEARLKQAQSNGQIPTALAAADLARVASAVLHSLAVRARSGAPKRQLDRLAETAVGLMTGGR